MGQNMSVLSATLTAEPKDRPDYNDWVKLLMVSEKYQVSVKADDEYNRPIMDFVKEDQTKNMAQKRLADSSILLNSL